MGLEGEGSKAGRAARVDSLPRTDDDPAAAEQEVGPRVDAPEPRLLLLPSHGWRARGPAAQRPAARAPLAGCRRCPSRSACAPARCPGRQLRSAGRDQQAGAVKAEAFPLATSSDSQVAEPGGPLDPTNGHCPRFCCCGLRVAASRTGDRRSCDRRGPDNASCVNAISMTLPHACALASLHHAESC